MLRDRLYYASVHCKEMDMVAHLAPGKPGIATDGIQVRESEVYARVW